MALKGYEKQKKEGYFSYPNYGPEKKVLLLIAEQQQILQFLTNSLEYAKKCLKEPYKTLGVNKLSFFEISNINKNIRIYNEMIKSTKSTIDSYIKLI
jgi:hypothetical protein